MAGEEKLDGAREALAGEGSLAEPRLRRAVAMACYMMAAADGFVSPDERARITKTLTALGTSPAAEVEALIEQVATALAAQGHEAAMAEIARDLPERTQRRHALAYAAAVAWVDGVLDFEEEVLLYDFGSALAVPQADVRALIDRFKVLVQRY